MKSVSIRKARSHLPRLVARAAKGEPFVITKAGRPLVKVIPLSRSNSGRRRRLGFLVGHITVPDDFDRMI